MQILKQKLLVLKCKLKFRNCNKGHILSIRVEQVLDSN